MKDNKDYEKFWTEREEQIGEPVLYKSIAKIESGGIKPQWALFYGTASRMFLQFFEKRNWFISLMNRGSESENAIFEIEYSRIESCEFFPEKTFLKIFKISEGMIKLAFAEKMEINSTLTCKSCVLLPMASVLELKEYIPV